MMESCTIEIKLPNGGMHFCQGGVDQRTGRTVIGNLAAEKNLCGPVDNWTIKGVMINSVPYKPFPCKHKTMALAVASACRWIEQGLA